MRRNTRRRVRTSKLRRRGTMVLSPFAFLAAPKERDVDAIGSDFHAAEQFHKYRFDFVRCGGSEFLRDLTATFDQLVPPWTIVQICRRHRGSLRGRRAMCESC